MSAHWAGDEGKGSRRRDCGCSSFPVQGEERVPSSPSGQRLAQPVPSQSLGNLSLDKVLGERLQPGAWRQPWVILGADEQPGEGVLHLAWPECGDAAATLETLRLTPSPPTAVPHQPTKILRSSPLPFLPFYQSTRATHTQTQYRQTHTHNTQTHTHNTQTQTTQAHRQQIQIDRHR